MTRREELAAALADDRNWMTSECETAIRERLAQLPEKCETCGGKGFYADGDQVSCSTCHGKGVLYPPALVERIAKALRDHDMKSSMAVAVLDTLNTEPAEIS